MLSFLPGILRGALIVLIIILNTMVCFPFLISVALLKFIIPIPALSAVCTKIAIQIATFWVGVNSSLFTIFLKIDWHINGLEGLSKDEWYLVNCNHQSWADIPVVQKVFNRKIPMLKFFLKQELIWVPLLGLCWWALDFPFMKRSTPEQIKKNPALAGKDLEVTRQACEKFKYTPVSVFNFMEGTRLTPKKHAKQGSPFEHLLKPKAGGAAFVLGSMGDVMHTMLDVTVLYPNSPTNIWDMFCGKVSTVVVDVRKVEIPQEFLGKDYTTDAQFKAEFQEWVNELWIHKDKHISELKAEYE
ncbi:acyltransferase [Oleiphilus sp. HI0071]|jgi:1-acyl-sn-glycerol-3-phosphate acyltransferase|uniref:acyltransferase n=2 Tax=Oleiphilus TaxID=141450 RepID=UPI0007C32C61|nr:MULTISPECIES: acyltransferase [unclassified Oleiphilus]KZY73439.1 acyltransferase [Oleiphilus sp. HI0065]KZY80253.1 acyltransferase [Oleiphilus sp. HI0071]KZY93397.1 acyltransferase [Oleiphilus sp. HI0073]KZZ52427.1 acyltransferase [Oleiphilus sp. HI0118]KZZ58932.1 acyltransferase [Oleiphilus sp. HI0122]KZZ72725.1 acyltransferase [Oleiphilus sp. HI0130]KZZ81537.1 acyltransferase [Oleiphilus sp. HI0133]